MSKVVLRKTKREQRKLRVRSKVFGEPTRPRLSVFRSNKYVYAQLIDDTKGVTLVSAGPKDLGNVKRVTVEKSKELGTILAKKALEKGIKSVRFDRNGYKYHGRVKGVAEGAREGGLIL